MSNPTLFRTEAISKLAQTVDSLKNNLTLTAPVTSPPVSRQSFLRLKKLFARFGGLPNYADEFVENTDTEIDISGLDNINSACKFDGMFNGCTNVETLDVSKWSFDYVYSAQQMFINCSSLTTLDVSNWNTDILIYAFAMFNGCSSLTSLDVSKWDTISLYDASEMFNRCSSLASLDVSKWNTPSLWNAAGMFAYCSNLTELDVSKWNTMHLQFTNNMFSNCSSLTHLDLRSWDLSNAARTRNMFEGCSSLTELIMTGATVKVLASDDVKDHSAITYPAGASLDDNTIYKLTGGVDDIYFVVSSVAPLE